MVYETEFDALEALMPKRVTDRPVILTPGDMSDDVWWKLREKGYVYAVWLPDDMKKAIDYRYNTGVEITDHGKAVLLKMRAEQQVLADLRRENELLKQWIRNEHILKDHATFAGTTWRTAYDDQRRIAEEVWHAIFGDATSVREWVIADVKRRFPDEPPNESGDTKGRG